MKALVKHNAVSVVLSDEEDRDLARVVEFEKRRRKDIRFGKATLLREIVMPRIREMLAAQQDTRAA